MTEGRPALVDQGGPDSAKALRLAAALESASEHPLGRAIVTAAGERGMHLPTVKNFRSIAGYGIEGEVVSRVGNMAPKRGRHNGATSGAA